MGFGSASNHTNEDTLLNVGLLLLNILTVYLIQRLLNRYSKVEFLWISAVTFAIWMALYIYYNL